MTRAPRHEVALAALFTACGPADPGVSSETRALVVHPDRITLLGAPSGRTIAVYLFEAGEAIAAGPIEGVSSRSEVAELAGDRVIARAPGRARIEIRKEGLEAAVEVEVLDRPAPFAREVLAFEPGAGAGFGRDRFPEIVLGPPEGGGAARGSLDVLSLGTNGTIAVGFGDLAAYDGPGPDLLVFENAFLVAGGGARFSEPARVSLASESSAWDELPCAIDDPLLAGCAGVEPVHASSMNRDIDPTDPRSAGGDAFDLGVFHRTADRVRLADAGRGQDLAPAAGFDLDAVGLVHALPKDAVALVAAEDHLALVEGGAAVVPRFDALRAGGGAIHGIPVRLSIEGEGTELDGVLVRSLGQGGALLRARAGDLEAVVSIEARGLLR